MNFINNKKPREHHKTNSSVLTTKKILCNKCNKKDTENFRIFEWLNTKNEIYIRKNSHSIDVNKDKNCFRCHTETSRIKGDVKKKDKGNNSFSYKENDTKTSQRILSKILYENSKYKSSKKKEKSHNKKNIQIPFDLSSNYIKKRWPSENYNSNHHNCLPIATNVNSYAMKAKKSQITYSHKYSNIFSFSKKNAKKESIMNQINQIGVSDCIEANKPSSAKHQPYKKPNLNMPLTSRTKVRKNLRCIEDTNLNYDSLFSERNLRTKEIAENVTKETSVSPLHKTPANKKIFTILSKKPMINKVFPFKKDNNDINNINQIIQNNIMINSKKKEKKQNVSKKDANNVRTPVLNKYINKINKENSKKENQNSETSCTEMTDPDEMEIESEDHVVKSIHTSHPLLIQNKEKDCCSDEFFIEKKGTNNVPYFRTNKFIDHLPSKNIKQFNMLTLKDIQLKSSFQLISFFLDKQTIISLISITKRINHLFKKDIYRKITEKIIYDKNNFNDGVRRSVFSFSPLSSEALLLKIYQEYKFMKSLYLEDIQKDLPRTFPDNPLFKPKGEYYIKLCNILKAYSNYNSKIGYAQGLNFLVGHSLFAFDKEEEVFIFIDGMIHKFEMENIIGLKNNLEIKMNMIGKLLRSHAKKVIEYLSRNGLTHDFFTANWILTIFANSMRTEILLKFWSFMIIFGWNFFNFFIVAILNKYANVIQFSEQTSLPLLMKNLLKTDVFESNFNSIIQDTFDLLYSNS